MADRSHIAVLVTRWLDDYNMLMEREHFLLTDPEATAHAVIDFRAAVSVHKGLGELLLLRLRDAGAGQMCLCWPKRRLYQW